MNYQCWIETATKELALNCKFKYEAEILLSYVTGRSRAFIVAFGETQLSCNELQLLNKLLIRRKIGEPIAYIIGECEFWSLPFYVSSATIIPRPDTECLVEQSLNRLPADKTCKILDLGTGTGAIALALASERLDCNVIAIDLLPDAVELVNRNINRLNLPNVNAIQSYWFNQLDGKLFNLIVSNPPYLDKEDVHLTQGDVRFEPRTALVAGNAGLADLEYIITYAKQYLYTNGWLLVEHGWKQGSTVRSLFIREQYQSVMTYCDYSGNERITLGRMM